MNNTTFDPTMEAATVTVPGNALLEDYQPLFEISADFYNQFTFIVNTITTPIICSLGLVGNCLGLGVLWRDSAMQQRLTICIYLWGLTLFDTAYLCFGLIRSIPRFIALSDKYLANYIEAHVQAYAIYIDMVITHTATAVIIVMSMERLTALVRPLTVRTMWLSQYPRHIIFLCFCVNVLFLIPYPVYFVVGSWQNHDNRTEYYIHVDPDYTEVIYYYQIVQMIVDYYIPASLMLATNVAIPVAYSRVIKQRTIRLQTTSLQNTQQTKITLAVLAITVMYFLLSLPNLFIKTLSYIDTNYNFDGRYRFVFWLFIDISNIFATINAANDFVIYILVSDHYRRIFKAMYCRCREAVETKTSIDSIGGSPNLHRSRATITEGD